MATARSRSWRSTIRSTALGLFDQPLEGHVIVEVLGHAIKLDARPLSGGMPPICVRDRRGEFGGADQDPVEEGLFVQRYQRRYRAAAASDDGGPIFARLI